jgi:cytochrome c2
MTAVPVWGAGQRRLCLSCHTVNHEDRGECVTCHRGNPLSERKNIAHAGMQVGKYVRFTLRNAAYIKDVQRLMETLACRRCHVSDGHGNRLSVNLDGSAYRKTAQEIAFSIRRPVANMPFFALDDERITVLINAISAGADGRKTAHAPPVRIHFSNSGKKGTDIFSTKCGSCHRMLNLRLGAIGSGDIGPNLSGLFSEFYPKTAPNGVAWNTQILRDWLKNPRTMRPGARMLPIELSETEMNELISML